MSTSHASGRPAPKVRPNREGPRVVEILIVGRDLLTGQIADGNGRYIADFFYSRGDRVARITTLDDNPVSIAAVLRETLERNPNVVVLTGGLGPAANDRTLEAVADALEQPLRESPSARDMVEAAYVKLHKSRLTDRAGMTVIRETLCRQPVGAAPIANPHGVAPGMITRLPGGSFVIALPGKPEEMRPMLTTAVGEEKELAPHGHRARQEVEAPFPDESVIRPMVERLAGEFPQVSISTRPVGSGKKSARVLVTVECVGATPEEAHLHVGNTVRRLIAMAGGGA